MSTSSNSASGGATGGWANAQPSAIDGNVPDVVWYRPGFMESASLYTRMVEIFSNDVEILRMLLLSMKPREVEEYAQCIVSIFTSTGRILPLIKSLLRHEFESRALSLHKSDMLRGSSAASKISGYYVRNIGGEYLQVLLGDLISEIVLNPDLDLEIQPTKFVSFYNRRNIDEEELEQKLEENRQRLMETAQIFIERIIDREFFTIIPRELRAIAAYTSQLAQEYSPGQVIPLVGGFVILRFLSPAIVTPESYNILPADVIPTPKARRNLVLLAKLLQNCSNGILYGAKEIYMTCMNDFVLRNGPSISQFLEVLIKDPLSPENAIGSRPFSDLDQTAPLQFKIQQIDIADLFTLHSLVYIFKDKLKMMVEEGTIEVQRNSLGNSNEGQNASHSPNNSGTSSSVLSFSSSTSLSPPSHASVLSPSIRIGRRVNTPNNLSVSGSSSSSSSTSSTSSSSSSSTTSASSGVPLTPLSLSDDKKSEILKFLVDLGPSPYITDKNRLAANHCYRRSKQVDLRDAEHLPMNYESMMGFGGVGGFGGGLESMTDQHTNSLEKGGFLYVGPNTKSGHPVLYIIVNRFRSEYMQNVDVLISYIHKVMLAIGDMRYVVVIDMSWANISKEMKRDVYQQLMKLGNIFDYTFRKNLERVYIVHPSAYTRAVILFMRSFTSNKLKSKIVEVFNWESLTNEIAPEDIALPETSKDFITKSYNVIKVNSKGKSQKRLIKFTPVSLLNIDPKTRRIQNEKKLSDIIQLGTFFSLDEIHIKFENHRESKKSFLGVQWKTEGDSSFRRYKILTRQDRDEIIEDVFRIGFQYGPVPLLPQEYRVTKVNKRGRHQERTFKFTCDSLLNIDNNSIKSEISFAGIENVEQDTHDPHVIWLQFKMESSRRKIICKDSTNLILALKEGMERYRQEDALALQREIYSDPSDDDQ